MSDLHIQPRIVTRRKLTGEIISQKTLYDLVDQAGALRFTGFQTQQEAQDAINERDEFNAWCEAFGMKLVD
jgi:hypothetical protein